MLKNLARKKIGVIAILCASTMWAVEPILAKLAYQTGDFLQTFASRTIFCFLTIALYVFFTQIKKLAVPRRYLPKLLYLSLVSTLLGDLMYIFALTRVPVVNAVIIGHIQPVFIVLFGFFVLKQDVIVRNDYVGIILMVVAGLMVSTRTFGNLMSFEIGTVGDLYVLIATFAWATTAIVARKYLRELPAGVIAFYRFLFAGIIFILYMVFSHGIEITSIYQVALGFVIGVGTVLYYEGIRAIKAAQVSALELSTPFFAAILGYGVLGEVLTFMQAIGMAFLAGGVYFLSKKE